MNILIIGGTGLISTEVVALALKQGHKVTVMNRGSSGKILNPDIEEIVGDINDETGAEALLKDRTFDVVVNFVVYTPDQAERDIRLFRDRCSQYIFISSASAYRKPVREWVITESTPLGNRFWPYSQDKEACEAVYMKAWREQGFPVTVVRPSHTYSQDKMPVAIHGGKGSYAVLKRMQEGKPVLVPGDGSSLWTLTWNVDFAAAFNGLFGLYEAIGQAYHITSDEALSWDMIYRTIGEALGVEPNLRHVSSDDIVAQDPEQRGPLLGDKSNSAVFDNTKIKRAVPGWTAKVRFHEGARIVWDYIQKHPELHEEDPEFDSFTESFL